MTISKTFCPAKWDEILVNLSANYVYSCCKSTPVQITRKEDINTALDQQRSNLLAGIQDPACDYCWKLENQGHTSLRHQYLDKFDITTYEQYKTNDIKIKSLEVSLGNECNFQCTYCNPKFSSQWESDVSVKPYQTFSDKFFFAVKDKNKNNIADTISWLESIGPIDNLNLLGGEPTQNKHFDKVINSIESKQLGFATNFSFKNTKKIDKLLKLADRYQKLSLGISIDSTDKNAEFSRYGLDFPQLMDNIRYLITQAPTNVDITILSLMTSITIRDLKNTSILLEELNQLRPSLTWTINYCRDPKILTLDTLPDSLKPNLIEQLTILKTKPYITGLDLLQGALETSKFNKSLYGQLTVFLREFSQRKNIQIPVDLNDA